MAFPKKLIDLKGISLTLMVLTLPSIVANIDCNGKPFHCVNSTHFMICVDLGSGVSSTIDDFVIECPPPTVCQITNKFECDFPVETPITVAPIEAPIVTSVSETLETVTTPYELTTSVPIEQYFDTSTTTTLSEDLLITHQTIAIVTESTTQLVTDVTQNNEVIIPLNETITSINVQNDLITTTSLPNNISIDATETIPDTFQNVNVTVPETELNSTVTEDISSADAVHTYLTSASTLPKNISLSVLVPVETENVNIITHEPIKNSTLNETIQSAIKLETNEQSLYTTSSIDMLYETTTETIPSLVDIQNNVTTHKPLPMYISANITGPINDTAENINAIISASIVNSTLNTTEPSSILDIVTTVLSNNITDITNDPVENITFSTKAVESKFNLSDIVESTTESMLYNVTESIPSTQNELTKLIPNNTIANATDFYLDATEKNNIVLSASEITTPNVLVLQLESTTFSNNKNDYVTDLIPNITETNDMIIPDATVQGVIYVARNEPTELSISNSTVNTTTSTDIVTELILTEVTKLASNETYLNSEALPIHNNDTTTKTTLNNFSETIQNIEVQKGILPDNSSGITKDDSKLNSILTETTSTTSNTAQTELPYISTSSTVIASPVAETTTEVLNTVTEITPNAPVNEVTNVNKQPILLSNFTSEAPISNATNTIVIIPESAIEYSLNATITTVDIVQSDRTTPLPTINDYTTILILDTTENTSVTGIRYNTALNETIQNKTHTAETMHTLLLNLSSSTALPDIYSEATWEKPIQIVGETTPSTYSDQNNFTKTVDANNTLSTVDLILDVRENVLLRGSETNLSETRSVNLVQNETISLTLPVTDLITEATKRVNVNKLEPERNTTLNVTVLRPDDIVYNYSDTLNSYTVPNNNGAEPSLSDDTVQTFYPSNTTLPDGLGNIVTELPVTIVTENKNVVMAEINLTLSDASLRDPETVTTNSSSSSLLSNTMKVETENIISNTSQQQPYAQNITASKPLIELIYTDHAKKISENETNQANSTAKVSTTSSFNLVNDKNKTVVAATTVIPEDLNAVTLSNININSPTSSVNNKGQRNKSEINTILNFTTSSLATLLPDYFADAISERNIESSTQHTDIRNDSHVELNFLENVKDEPVNIPNTVQIAMNSITEENSNLEIVPISTTNIDTTTSTSELVNQGYDIVKTDTNTINKVTTEMASEYGMRTFQTEFTTARETVVSDTLAAVTESLGNAYITDSATVNSIAGVTESYYERNVTNTLTQNSVGAVNIVIETTKEIKSILVSSEPISYGQITTATSISSKSSTAQDTVNSTTTNILFTSRAPSPLTQKNIAAAVQYESYTESTVNTDVNLQKSISNEFPRNKIDHTIQNSSTDTLNTSVVHNNLTQETKNFEITSEKSNLTKIDQNQGKKTNKQENTLLEILTSTPISLLISSQPNVPQTKYAAANNTILSMDNLTHHDYYVNNTVQIKVYNETKLGIELNAKSTENKTNTKETVVITHDKENETIFIQTKTVSRPSQPTEESSQISNSSQTINASTFPADQDNVALKLDSPDVLIVRPTTEAWRATVVTKPYKDQDIVTSKQYLTDTPTLRPYTESWRATVITKPYINQDYETRKLHFAITSGFKNSTEPWRPTVVTARQIDQETATLKQYTTDPPTLKPSTEAWRTLAIKQSEIEETEPSKLPAIKESINSANKKNEGISEVEQRVINNNTNEKPLMDIKPTTEPVIELWSKVPQNGDGIVDNSQTKQHLPAPTMKTINIYPITQKTEPVITETLVSNVDIDFITIDIVKTNVPLSIQSNSPTGTYSDMSVKLPRTDKGNKNNPEEIESVEQPEGNEEQEISEYEESQREKMEEQLEASGNERGELNNAGVVSTQNNIKIGSTVEMTTEKVEDKSYKHYKSITNIEVQPTIVKSTVNLEETKVDTTKQIGRNANGNVKNSTVGYSLPKPFVNTYNVTPPVFEAAKSSFVCKLNSRGKFPDNNDCKKFYICNGKHEPIEGLCPNNTVFSELRKQCTKNFSHCVRNNQFQCVLEGRFSDYINDNIYYICVKNNIGTFTRFKLQCQSGYHLNKTSVRCALNTESSRLASQQSISDISKNSEQSVSSARSEKLVVEPSNKFECKSEGKFPDPNNCRKYYVCSKKNGKSRYRQKRKKCDSDEIFHKDKKKCVDAESYDCS